MYDFTDKIKKYIDKNQNEQSLTSISSIFSISHIYKLSDECREWYIKNQEYFDKNPKTFDSVCQMQNSIEMVKKLVIKTKQDRINRNSQRVIETNNGRADNLDVKIRRKSFKIPVMGNENREADHKFQQLAKVLLQRNTIWSKFSYRG